MPLSLFVFRQGLQAVTDALFIKVKPHNHAVVINRGRCVEIFERTELIAKPI